MGSSSIDSYLKIIKEIDEYWKKNDELYWIVRDTLYDDFIFIINHRNRNKITNSWKFYSDYFEGKLSLENSSEETREHFLRYIDAIFNYVETIKLLSMTVEWELSEEEILAETKKRDYESWSELLSAFESIGKYLEKELKYPPAFIEIMKSFFLSYKGYMKVQIAAAEDEKYRESLFKPHMKKLEIELNRKVGALWSFILKDLEDKVKREDIEKVKLLYETFRGMMSYLPEYKKKFKGGLIAMLSGPLIFFTGLLAFCEASKTGLENLKELLGFGTALCTVGVLVICYGIKGKGIGRKYLREGIF